MLTKIEELFAVLIPYITKLTRIEKSLAENLSANSTVFQSSQINIPSDDKISTSPSLPVMGL